MKVLAWSLLALLSIGIIGEPFMYGKPREPHGPSTWIGMMLSALWIVPLIGRVLGWW